MKGDFAMKEWSKVATTAERLRLAIDNAKIKAADLSRMTELSKGTIHHYLAGTYEPKSTAINKLAVALNVSESWLWGYDVPMERTDMQKKNDQLVKLVTRLRRDERFASAVSMLDEVSDDQFDNIVQILTAFTQK